MDYMALFPSAARGSPRFAALAQAVLAQVNDLQAVVADLPKAYSVRYAAGKQLDDIGNSFMIPRPSGYSDGDYRLLLQSMLKLYAWDGANDTAQVLLNGISPAAICDHCDGSVSIGQLPHYMTANKAYPVPAGVRAILE